MRDAVIERREGVSERAFRIAPSVSAPPAPPAPTYRIEPVPETIAASSAANRDLPIPAGRRRT
jgi:hypothetical protein